jgi:adenylate kinase
LIVVFLGAPGAGKGTQATMVAQKLNLTHISSGDLFRKAVESGDEIGLKVKDYMNRGALVPDEITTQMVLARMKQNGQKKGTILDGFPRNLSQAEFLGKALAKERRAINRAVYIKVAKKELLRRLSNRWLCRNCQIPYNCSGDAEQQKCQVCGGGLYQRPDDTSETVTKRLKVYFKETEPLIEYYRKQGKLSEIDGEGEVGQVSDRIIGSLVAQPD